MAETLDVPAGLGSVTSVSAGAAGKHHEHGEFSQLGTGSDGTGGVSEEPRSGPSGVRATCCLVGQGLRGLLKGLRVGESVPAGQLSVLEC